MNTIFSSLARGIRRLTVAVATLVLSLQGSTLLAQQMMSIGDIQFALPNARSTMASRIIRMKMAGSNINSLYYYLVGGIAFTQQAIPDIKVNSLDMQYSTIDNSAYITINGNSITIPIHFFELKPIVNFANSDDDVVMTMYGAQYGEIHKEEKQDILFHPAFIDNMMGLRLLQVDALTLLSGMNGEFPIFDDGNYCLTFSEWTRYQRLCRQYEANGGSYIDNSQSVYSKIYDTLDEGNICSYIYTDLGQPIHFSIDNNKISFDGLPYYQFSTNSTNEIDPVVYYYWMKYFVNNYDKMLTPYYTKEMVASIKIMMEPYTAFFEELESRPNMSDEEKADELMALVNEGFDSIGRDSALALLYKTAMVQICPMLVSADDVTETLKRNATLVRQLNPIVYQEVDDICQWSALFRYVKANEPEVWSRFVSQVNAAGLKTPEVQTPIAIKYDDQESVSYGIY